MDLVTSPASAGVLWGCGILSVEGVLGLDDGSTVLLLAVSGGDDVIGLMEGFPGRGNPPAAAGPVGLTAVGAAAGE